MYVVLTQLKYSKSKPLTRVLDCLEQGLGERPVTLSTDEFDWSATTAVVSFLWNKIIPKRLFRQPAHGTFNIHPSYLPENRGSCPNFWAIRRGRGAGWTLHRVDEKIDTGNILLRHRTMIRQNETGEELWVRLLSDELDRFLRRLRTALGLFDGFKNYPAIPQDPHWPTYKLTDFHAARNLMPDSMPWQEREWTRTLLSTILAATFTGHDGAYMDTENGRVYFKAYKKEDDDES